MGRINCIWIVNVYYDREKTELFKVLQFNTLKEISYCLDTKVHDVSNVYHKIKKPCGVFEKLYIYKSVC
jgi:hypothetical protein